MQAFSGIDAVRLNPGVRSAVTVGNFDGVHAGHQRLLRRTVVAAGKLGGPACAVTFWPHPHHVLTGKPPRLLATLDQRSEWIAACGVDTLVVQSFDAAFARVEPEAFLERLTARLQAGRLLLGHDFRFGYRGRGNFAMAAEFGRARDIAVEEIAAVQLDGAVVSSSHIRMLLAAGDVRRARAMLGRPWQIVGRAVRGAGRGRTLGYPTINLAADNDLLVPDGVYGGRVRLVTGEEYVAAISVGTNPTFGGEPRHAEAYLFEFNGECAADRVCFEFWSYVRAQVTFSGATALMAQISADVGQIRDAAAAEGWLR